MTAVDVRFSTSKESNRGKKTYVKGSNPARCFGYVMEELQARSKLPIRMSYRSIGSSMGLEEFKNNMSLNTSAINFGSGELPLSSEDWSSFQDQNVETLHFPVLFGAVSFFHSVPNTPNLNLTSCLLAKIFTRKIRDWAHPDILEVNPELSKFFDSASDSLGASLRIRVARREEGAGNTKAITEYLNKACPDHFPSEMVSDLPDWPEDTEACRGTLGMNDCISARAGTIGYNEAGIGWFADLQEISLKNKYGRLLTSKQAMTNGGIGAQEPGILPSDPRDDFGSVSLMDQDGEYTWPITLLTYLYVRTDLRFKTDPLERALLVAFVKALYNPDFVQHCEDSFGFAIAAGPALKLGQRGIEILEEGLLALDENHPTWTFEEKAEAIVGARDLVISANRRNYAALERESNLHDVEQLELVVSELQKQIANLMSDLDDPNSPLNSNGGNDSAEFTSQYEAMLLSALIIAVLSMALTLAVVGYTVRGRNFRDDAKHEEQAP